MRDEALRTSCFRKGFDSSSLTVPRSSASRPDRERYERFLERAG